MAERGKKVDSSMGKPKVSPLINRSFTARSTTPKESPFEKPQHRLLQSNLDRSGSLNKLDDTTDSVRGKVKKLRDFFESGTHENEETQTQSSSKLKPVKSLGSRIYSSPFCNFSSIRLPGTEDRIVVYFTSLRGVRRTYEDCHAVRMIFRGFRVCLDERDISMDLAYKKELQCVLGKRKGLTLPQVFMSGRYVGGSDVIKHLFEVGELAKMLEGFPKRKPGFVCETCGDVRFVPCMTCSGSRKIFDEDDEIMKRCMECNENGLLRCADCCS